MTTWTLRIAGLTSALIASTALIGCAHDGASAGPSAETTPAPAAPETTAAAAQAPAANAIETKDVTYDAGGVSMKGFIAYPAAQGARPGVLVVHEWWGLNDYSRARARKLAELGYVGFAVDMYGEGKLATHPEDATKFMMEVMSKADVAAARFAAAKALLVSDPRVDPNKIAAIGYCMGGAVVLNMARAGNDLDAVVSFHGNLSAQAPMKAGAFAGAMLVMTGGADPFVPPEQVEAFKKEMDAAGQKYDLVTYPGVKHAFTNPEATENGKKFNIPLEYNPEADAASWALMSQLFTKIWS